MEVYLGLGGNVGDSVGILCSAIVSLGAYLRDLRASSFYRTAPRYIESQAPFLNAVVRGLTDLAPGDLLRAVQTV
ncbi:MAG TPA: 2-amino-4-hydroxy-6-hydroxymethyldihydropteridine diphosphokinase, partial [Magnetospirillaceae bacterium]|nr:2-amino-4-hydroxy-6-hydroxymethyldihydropteridine diphosphokinase [Magnetospirillaceae bacterium]